MVKLEAPDHKGFLETLAEMERKVVLVLSDPTETKGRWGSQVRKVRKVWWGPVGYQVHMGHQDLEA